MDLGVVGWAVLISIALAVGLWGPYLYKEIRRGKVQAGPRTPPGTGDPRVGRPGNPAPGQPSGQPDPYDPQAQR